MPEEVRDNPGDILPESDDEGEEIEDRYGVKFSKFWKSRLVIIGH